MNPTLLTTTEAVDPVFKFIFGVSLLLFVGIAATMLWFVIRYRRARAPQPTSQVAGNLWLEIVWTLLPTILVLAMFYYGWVGYLILRRVPEDALTVTAQARMWSWNFSYANGRTSPTLVVPVGRPVLVQLVSSDVLHGFFIPAFRVKRDVVPGMENHVWFVADRPGSYDLFCSVYCGTGHAAMTTTVVAVPRAEFDAWLSQVAAIPTTAADGARLAEEKGCLACHSRDGSPGIGPTFKGLFGQVRQVTHDGKTVTVAADEDYLRESILTPAAKIVVGYPPVMPPMSELQEAELAALVAFLKGLK